MDARLVAAAERLDSRTHPIAETNRRVGRVADELGLPRPSYERIRTLIHASRQHGRQPTTGDVLLDIAFRARPPAAFVEHLVGTLPPDP